MSPLRRVLCTCMAVCATGAAAAADDTAATLKRATQAMMDALAPGNAAVWARYTDPELLFVTEDNEVKNRAQVLADLKPLPAGYFAWITVEEFQCRILGGIAISTYLVDEHESIEGQLLHAFYRNTDTWRRTPEGWRLLASQEFAIQQDPPRASGTEHLTDYEGTYALSATTRQNIHSEADHLAVERSGRPAQLLLRESGDVFFTAGHPRTRRVFLRGADGQVSGFADRREGIDLVWTRLAAPAAGR
jgi:ketosteroid isomerase-like protein